MEDTRLDAQRYAAALAELPALLARFAAGVVHPGSAAVMARHLATPPPTLGALLALSDEINPAFDFARLFLARRSLTVAPTTLHVTPASHHAVPPLVGRRRFHHGAIVVAGNLNIDNDLWVTGDLTIAGVCRVRPDWTPVYVGGSVRARAVSACSSFVAGEAMLVDEVIFAEEHGEVGCGGRLGARLLVESSIGGTIDAHEVDAAAQRFTSKQMFDEAIACRERLDALLDPALFADGDKRDDDDDLFSFPSRLLDALAAGRAIWRAPVAATRQPRLPPRLTRALAAPDVAELDLSGGRLAALPPEIGRLTKLTKLELGHNQLTALPDELGELTALEELWCDSNQLTTLPAALGKLTQLRRIIALGNQLATLPDALAGLTRLEFVNFIRNAFTELPRVVHGWATLTGAALSGNPLPTLDEAFTALPVLRSLELGGGLQSLPRSFGRLALLERLYIFDGELTMLPESFVQLAALRDVSLIGQRFTHVPPELLALPSVTSLTLHRNALVALPESIPGWRHLESLSLGDNRLTQVPDAIFALPKLRALYLTNNNFSETEMTRLRGRAAERRIDIYLR